MSRPVLTVVAPVYNEQETLHEFYRRTTDVLAVSREAYELIFVNDGSSDASAAVLAELCVQDPHVRILTFSRNFGHQIAVKAGVDHAQGDAVVMIDADLQDPPEEIPALIAKWREGYDVVYTTRIQREGETFLKKWTASVFYKILAAISSVSIPRDSGDFRLISREVADVIRSIREKNPYLRGLVAWAGFRQVSLPIHRHARHAGQSKYSLTKMLHLAWSGITHFSIAPLFACAYLGAILILLGVLAAVWGLTAAPDPLRGNIGWILAAVCVIGGFQLMATAILGLYLGRNYDESRGRPLYILKQQG